jgi:D-alanyl-lipoteichoic acid acyltransferase DltB (MBOAT superfamily)
MVVAAIFALMEPLSHIQAVRESFLLDHALKVAMFVVLMEAGSYLMQTIERLLGFDTSRPMRDFYLSLTPAEFWSRYNTRIHSWLEANVYRPCGGGIRGVVAVFLFSAAFHELAFDIATSHPDGYQFTFFMLQAPAVIASPSLKRFADRYGAAGQALVRMLTIAWFFFTSIFFFRGVERVFPIVYASQPWLP